MQCPSAASCTYRIFCIEKRCEERLKLGDSIASCQDGALQYFTYCVKFSSAERVTKKWDFFGQFSSLLPEVITIGIFRIQICCYHYASFYRYSLIVAPIPSSKDRDGVQFTRVLSTIVKSRYWSLGQTGRKKSLETPAPWWWSKKAHQTHIRLFQRCWKLEEYLWKSWTKEGNYRGWIGSVGGSPLSDLLPLSQLILQV